MKKTKRKQHVGKRKKKKKIPERVKIEIPHPVISSTINTTKV